jgi:hypothetical protein
MVWIIAISFTLLSFGELSCASFAKNLNYRSPSENHPSLGINLRKVHKRQAPGASYTPSQLNFTHGVASGGQLNTREVWYKLRVARPYTKFCHSLDTVCSSFRQCEQQFDRLRLRAFVQSWAFPGRAQGFKFSHLPKLENRLRQRS